MPEKLGHTTGPGQAEQVGGIRVPVTHKSPVHCSCYMTCSLPSRPRVQCRQIDERRQMISNDVLSLKLAYQYAKFYHNQCFFSVIHFFIINWFIFSVTITVAVNLQLFSSYFAILVSVTVN